MSFIVKRIFFLCDFVVSLLECTFSQMWEKKSSLGIIPVNHLGGRDRAVSLVSDAGVSFLGQWGPGDY